MKEKPQKTGIKIIDEEAITIKHCEALIQQAKAEVAREIFEEVEKHMKTSKRMIGRYLGEEHLEIFIGLHMPKDSWQSLKSKYPQEEK
jgi:hypothetical protein